MYFLRQRAVVVTLYEGSSEQLLELVLEAFFLRLCSIRARYLCMNWIECVLNPQILFDSVDSLQLKFHGS